jgi:hypothetical protein
MSQKLLNVLVASASSSILCTNLPSKTAVYQQNCLLSLDKISIKIVNKKTNNEKLAKIQK